MTKSEVSGLRTSRSEAASPTLSDAGERRRVARGFEIKEAMAMHTTFPKYVR